MIEFTISIEDYTDDWDDFKYIKDFSIKITENNTIDEIKKLIDFLNYENLYDF